MPYVLQKQNYRRCKEKLKKIRNLYRKKRSCWHIFGRDDVLWRNIRQGISPDDAWKKNFLMPNGHFEALVTQLPPYISPNPLSPNRRARNAEKKVVIILWTVSVVITEVCEAISKSMGPKFISLLKENIK